MLFGREWEWSLKQVTDANPGLRLEREDRDLFVGFEDGLKPYVAAACSTLITKTPYKRAVIFINLLTKPALKMLFLEVCVYVCVCVCVSLVVPCLPLVVCGWCGSPPPPRFRTWGLSSRRGCCAVSTGPSPDRRC